MNILVLNFIIIISSSSSSSSSSIVIIIPVVVVVVIVIVIAIVIVFVTIAGFLLEFPFLFFSHSLLKNKPNEKSLKKNISLVRAYSI